MKLKVLKCPECRANLEIEEGRASCFCQYCGCKIILDEEETKVTKNINITQRYINDAEIVKAEYKDKKDKRSYLFIAVWWGVLLAILLGVFLYFNINSKLAESEGKISAGFYRDLEGQNYETVVAHFKSAGFTNIELIDLKNSGMAFWNDGEVEQISIGGNTSFESHNYFLPDTKVVISYH